jgi:hypothetical protein
MSITDVKNEGIEEMLTHCRLYYRNNRVELNSIDEFRRNYVRLFSKEKRKILFLFL